MFTLPGSVAIKSASAFKAVDPMEAHQQTLGDAQAARQAAEMTMLEAMRGFERKSAEMNANLAEAFAAMEMQETIDPNRIPEIANELQAFAAQYMEAVGPYLDAVAAEDALNAGG